MLRSDYLIIGQGLAGSCFALECLQNNRSFILIDQETPKASAVAGGLVNPVVLKRFTPVWRAEELLKQLNTTFESFEKLSGKTYRHERPLYRIFHDESEVRTWQKKSAENPLLKPFLNPVIQENPYPPLHAPYGLGHVKQSGQIAMMPWLKDFRNYLKQQGLLLTEHFDHKAICFEKEQAHYHDFQCRHIVFCEGYGLKQNPFFNRLPLTGNKGEILKIRAHGIGLEAIIQSKVFLAPLGKDEYSVGATYERDDLSPEPTEKARTTLLTKLKTFFSGKFELIDCQAGIRPTVIDRKPLVGRHPEHPALAILNGLGSRGVLLAPTMARLLFKQIEYGHPLPPEVDIKRFD